MNKRGFFSKAVLIIVFVCTFFLAVSISSAFSLPDTGQTKCYSDKGKIKAITCPAPGQSLAQDGSYTINPPSYRVNPDGTVIDNNTLLMWQQVSNFTGTWPASKSYCEDLTLGGYNDWRLPTRRELISIVNYGLIPSCDMATFPSICYAYWTGTTNFCGEPWAVDFFKGNFTILSQTNTAETKCVRGSPLPDADFVNNNDGTVSDLSTNLMWKKEALGQMGWGAALGYCESLTLGGHSDWRLPNIKELESLSVNTLAASKFFTLGTSFPYWSSTTYIATGAGIDYRRTIQSGNAGIYSVNDKNSSNLFVQCVRSSQAPPLLDTQKISVDHTSLEFWYHKNNGITSNRFIISNGGIGDLLVAPISAPSAPFSIISDECSGRILPLLSSCSVTVDFSTSETGTFTDIITISSNDSDHPIETVTLSGNVWEEFYLPDTGQTSCFTTSGYGTTCPAPGNSLTQDGSYNINPPSYSANGDGTVTDNNTLLKWQQEDNNMTYQWDNAVSYCDELTLGGHSDWRLPHKKELLSIVNLQRYNPAIDSSLFPNTKETYWSSTIGDDNEQAWYVRFISDMGFGGLSQYPKSDMKHVRCVHGIETPSIALVDNGNGSVTDLVTGLMWQRAGGYHGNWGSALSYCEGLTLGGFSDWRLPNFRELASIGDKSRYDISNNIAFFDNYCGSHWSSTTVIDSRGIFSFQSYVYVVGFPEGAVGNANFDSFTYPNTRCVRGGNLKPQSGGLKGTVSDSSSGSPLSSVSITSIDVNKSQSAITDTAGKYTISNMTTGLFTATFSKSGYITQTTSGTTSSGQTQTLNVQLSPILPLTLTISSPQNGAVLNTSLLTVTGSVSNNASVRVNGIQAAVSGGIFTAAIPLIEGINTITATASDQYGQTKSQSVTVTLILPKPPQITNISANNITTDSAVISWTTDQPSDSLVEYGETTAYGSTASNTGSVTTHTVTLNNLSPDRTYHFKVISRNAESLSSASGDNTFTTLQFKATTVGDYGNVTVIEVNGNYDAKIPDGSLNTLPRQEIAKEFLRTHQDQYDFIVVVSNFDFAMPQAGAKAFYLEIKNDVQGIGKPIFNNSSLFGSNSKLQGMVDMGNISGLGTGPLDPKFEVTLATLAHEQMHRWGAGVHFRDAAGNISSALLGKDGNHWNYLLDTEGSLMYGNDWKDNGNGTYTSVSASKYYSPLDLYLMGFYDRTQVLPMLLIENPSIDPTGLPAIGSTVSGTSRQITIDDIIAAEGERVPNSAVSQKSFKIAFIFITRPGTFTGNEIQGIENIRNAWAGWFASLTNGKGAIADVAPSISSYLSSPSDGETISKSYVTVKGAIIKSTGNETGVTVNGVPATVYGNQFIANHVPLTEGANTITVTATDTPGNTSTQSLSVTAVTTDNYIRLTSNIESSIAPLEVNLRVDGSFGIDNSNLHIVGPVQPEVLSSTPEEYRLKFTVEGVYYVTASSIGPDGQTYQDTIAITVMNRNQLDMLLKAKWEGMKGELMAGNIEGALMYFAMSSRNRYRDLLAEFTQEQLAGILSNVIGFDIESLNDGSAECEATRNETAGEYSYPVTFVRDGMGLWKIMGL